MSKIITCRSCGKSIQVKPSLANKIYCSKECYRSLSVIDRFWSKVAKTDTCWLWTAGTFPSGYGHFSKSHEDGIPAHRFSWEISNGKIPDGLFVCHTCDTPPCVNPAHLFLGTHQDNMDDMVSKSRQVRGQEMNGAKLSEVQVVEIRRRYMPGVRGLLKSIAADFGLDKCTVLRIVKRQAWRHI